MTPSRTPTVHGGEHVSRIDDARAAELDKWLGAPAKPVTERDHDRAVVALPDALADCADYKARIEELEAGIAECRKAFERVIYLDRREECVSVSHYDGPCGEVAKAALAKLPTPSPTDAPASDMRDAPDNQVVIRSGDLYWRANAAGYTVSIFEAGKYSRAEAERLTAGIGPEKGISIIAAPPPQPASDTRALAVEIDDEAVEASREAFWQKASEGTCGAHYPRADVMRAALAAALPLILRKALPPASDTDRTDERERLALAICGGEDAPGHANAQTVETLERIAAQNYADFRERAEAADRKLARAVEALRRAEDEILTYRFQPRGDEDLLGFIRSTLADLTTAPAEAEMETGQ